MTGAYLGSFDAGFRPSGMAYHVKPVPDLARAALLLAGLAMLKLRTWPRFTPEGDVQ